ncbi:hypothetical protein NL676_004450 [Syzygium grande]|nr:hypothetical protein NL676_004450 [Syzygium grande]
MMVGRLHGKKSNRWRNRIDFPLRILSRKIRTLTRGCRREPRGLRLSSAAAAVRSISVSNAVIWLAVIQHIVGEQ